MCETVSNIDCGTNSSDNYSSLTSLRFNNYSIDINEYQSFPFTEPPRHFLACIACFICIALLFALAGNTVLVAFYCRWVVGFVYCVIARLTPWMSFRLDLFMFITHVLKKPVNCGETPCARRVSIHSNFHHVWYNSQ